MPAPSRRNCLTAKLVFLKGVGHMPHHAAPETVAAAIDELVPTG